MKNIIVLFACLLAVGASAQDYNLTYRSSMEFPNQTLGNVWGYTQGGKEYALLGGQLGLIIVDVTDPEHPIQITQIPGPNNLWKEVKTYEHYAYATTEGGPVQVIDLSPLPSPNLPVVIYDGDDAIDGLISNVHALHVDEKKGFLYLYGATSAGAGGALVCDLKPNPASPHFVGQFQTLGYIHDGFVDNDTLYGGHIYAGVMSVVDMTDKQNPQALGSTPTPNAFTHNTWPTDDRKAVLTTDELDGSTVAAYDISNPANIVELDRFQCTPGSGSVPHNTHILDDYAVTSWYTDGVSIIDASRPSNLIQVARYDTYPEAEGGGYNGCWGAYPFFPSGNIIATNIPIAFAAGTGKMFVLTPTYKRACWLEGKVTNGITGEPLSQVTIGITSPDPLTATTTGLVGTYTTGQVTAGTFEVSFFKNGFQPKTVDATLTNGVVTILDVELYPNGTSGTDWLEEEGASLAVNPTVFSQQAVIELTFPQGTQQAILNLTDISGKTIWSKVVDSHVQSVVFDAGVANGTYFLTMHTDGKQTKAVKVVKM